MLLVLELGKYIKIEGEMNWVKNLYDRSFMIGYYTFIAAIP